MGYAHIQLGHRGIVRIDALHEQTIPRLPYVLAVLADPAFLDVHKPIVKLTGQILNGLQVVGQWISARDSDQLKNLLGILGFSRIAFADRTSPGFFSGSIRSLM